MYLDVIIRRVPEVHFSGIRAFFERICGSKARPVPILRLF